MTRVRADLNGVFGDLLCLSHDDACVDETGDARVVLREGMALTAFEEDEEAGRRDDLIAHGVVERAPDRLGCRGSTWVLRIGRVLHASDP